MFIHQNFTGEGHRHLIGVCDGHGMLGHHVSGVLRTEVPKYMECHLDGIPASKILDSDLVKDCI